MKPEAQNTEKENPRLWLVFLILLPWVLNSLRQPGSDFAVFTTTVHDWAAGRTQLYDAAHVYYNYLPWSLLIYLPFSYLPRLVGELIFNTLSLGLLIWSTWSLVKPVKWWVLAVSLTTIYTGLHLLLAQWDILVLAALTLGWLAVQHRKPWLLGLALVVMTTKYINIILPMLLLLYMVRRWSLKELLKVAAMPVAILPISFLIAGVDWPVRYWRLMHTTLSFYDHFEALTLFSTTTYKTSYWRYLPPLGPAILIILAGISLYIFYRFLLRRITIEALILALSLNMVVTPYLAIYHIVYLAPVQAYLLKEHRILGILLFAVSVVDLVFMWLRIGVILYSITTLILLLGVNIYREWQQRKAGASPALGAS